MNASVKQAEKDIKSYILPGNNAIRTRFIIATAVLIPVFLWILFRGLRGMGSADGSCVLSFIGELMLTAALWLIFAKPYSSIYGNAAKCLRVLRKHALTVQAAEELQAGRNDESGQDKRAGVLAERFLFARNIGSVLCYDDIVCVYPLVYRFIDGRRLGILCAKSKTRRRVMLFYLGPEDIDSYAEQTLAAIRTKAPNVTMGETKHRFSLHTFRYARERRGIVKIRNS